MTSRLCRRLGSTAAGMMGKQSLHPKSFSRCAVLRSEEVDSLAPAGLVPEKLHKGRQFDDGAKNQPTGYQENEEKVKLALATSVADDSFQTFPDEDTADTLFNGIKYKDLPYVHVKCTQNNTRIAAYTSDHQELWYTTAVAQGFPHSKKKSGVAAQAVGLAMGQKLRTMNQRTVRARVDGFNMGRVPVMQGLVQAGINVVSVSDCTWIDWFWQKRAKKRRRV